MTINEIEEAGKVVGAIVAIVGAVKIWPIIKRVGKFLKDCALAPLRISRVISELQPNGGSSLRDSINRIEQAQTVLSQKLAYTIDQSGAGFFYANPDGDCVEVSPGYCRLVGKGESESLGKRWIFNIHVKDRLRVIQDWKEAVVNSAVFEAKYSMVDASGEEFYVRCHASPIKNSTLAIIGYFGIVEPMKEYVNNET